MANQDVFIPLATGPVPNTIKSRNDHPVPKKGIVSCAFGIITPWIDPNFVR